MYNLLLLLLLLLLFLYTHNPHRIPVSLLQLFPFFLVPEGGVALYQSVRNKVSGTERMELNCV